MFKRIEMPRKNMTVREVRNWLVSEKKIAKPDMFHRDSFDPYYYDESEVDRVIETSGTFEVMYRDFRPWMGNGREVFSK